MKKSFAFIALCVMVQTAALFAQETHFVSPKGSDNSKGTYASPFRTIQHAVNEAGTGDVILVYGNDGNYSYGETVTVDKDLTISATPVNADFSISTDKIVIAEGTRVVVTGFAEKTEIEGTLSNGTKPTKK